MEVAKFGSNCTGNAVAAPAQTQALLSQTRYVTEVREQNGIGVVVLPSYVGGQVYEVNGTAESWSSFTFMQFLLNMNWVWNQLTVVQVVQLVPCDQQFAANDPGGGDPNNGGDPNTAGNPNNGGDPNTAGNPQIPTTVVRPPLQQQPQRPPQQVSYPPVVTSPPIRYQRPPDRPHRWSNLSDPPYVPPLVPYRPYPERLHQRPHSDPGTSVSSPVLSTWGGSPRPGPVVVVIPTPGGGTGGTNCVGSSCSHVVVGDGGHGLGTCVGPSCIQGLSKPESDWGHKLNNHKGDGLVSSGTQGAGGSHLGGKPGMVDPAHRGKGQGHGCIGSYCGGPGTVSNNPGNHGGGNGQGSNKIPGADRLRGNQNIDASHTNPSSKLTGGSGGAKGSTATGSPLAHGTPAGIGGTNSPVGNGGRPGTSFGSNSQVAGGRPGSNFGSNGQVAGGRHVGSGIGSGVGHIDTTQKNPSSTLLNGGRGGTPYNPSTMTHNGLGTTNGFGRGGTPYNPGGTLAHNSLGNNGFGRGGTPYNPGGTLAHNSLGNNGFGRGGTPYNPGTMAHNGAGTTNGFGHGRTPYNPGSKYQSMVRGGKPLSGVNRQHVTNNKIAYNNPAAHKAGQSYNNRPRSGFSPFSRGHSSKPIQSSGSLGRNKTYSSRHRYGSLGRNNTYSSGRGHGSYGRSSYGRSSYGRSSYGRSPYGRSSYGRSSYGRSSYGRSSYGRSSYGHSSYGRSSYGRSSYGRSSYGRSSYGRSSYRSGGFRGGFGGGRRMSFGGGGRRFR